MRLSFDNDNEIGIDPQDLILDHMRYQSLHRYTHCIHEQQQQQQHSNRSPDLISVVLNTGPVCWDTNEFALTDPEKIGIVKVWYTDEQPGVAIGIHSLPTEVSMPMKLKEEATTAASVAAASDAEGGERLELIVKNKKEEKVFGFECYLDEHQSSKKRAIEDANDNTQMKPSNKRKNDDIAAEATDSSSSSSSPQSLTNVKKDFGAKFDSMAMASESPNAKANALHQAKVKVKVKEAGSSSLKEQISKDSTDRKSVV